MKNLRLAIIALANSIDIHNVRSGSSTPGEPMSRWHTVNHRHSLHQVSPNDSVWDILQGLPAFDLIIRAVPRVGSRQMVARLPPVAMAMQNWLRALQRRDSSHST